MTKVPSAVWIVDTNKEHIAVGEAKKLDIPVVAILDTNCDPDVVDFPIPGNDDAIRAVALLTRVIADAVADGLMARAGRGSRRCRGRGRRRRRRAARRVGGRAPRRCRDSGRRRRCRGCARRGCRRPRPPSAEAARSRLPRSRLLAEAVVEAPAEAVVEAPAAGVAAEAAATTEAPADQA